LNRLLIINKLADQGVPLVKIAATLEATDPEDDKDAGIDLITTTTRREAELFEGIRVSYLPNLLTRSELKKLSEYIEEMMREKGYASKSERSKAGKI
jgi:DNA-binding transcriptional MerR regulator